MTISITASQASYISNGSNLGPYPVKSGASGIYIESASDLTVTTLGNGTSTTLVLGSDYSVSGAGSDVATITLVSPVPAGHTIIISRNTPITQSLNLSHAGAFSPLAIMSALDKCARIDQDQQRQIEDVESRVQTADQIAAAAVSAAESATIAAAAAAAAAASVNEMVSVKDFGAVGDGVATDTQAFLNALATGNSVFVPRGTYKITEQLTLQTAGQRVYGDGRDATTIVPVGSFDLFRMQGSVNGLEVSDLYILGTSHTGHAFSASFAFRSAIRNIRISNPDKVFYGERLNYFEIESVHVNNVRGAYGIKWYGTSALRSDLLFIRHVTMSSTNGIGCDGFIWDGNCNSLVVSHLGLVRFNRGMVIQDTEAASTPPLIARIFDLEVDFPDDDGVYITAGYDFDFVAPYLQGSIGGSGINVAYALPSNHLRIIGGKATGNNQYGVETSANIIASNLWMQSNLVGAVGGSGLVRSISDRVEIATDAYYHMSGGNPRHVHDANDFDDYVRSSNRRRVVIGGTEAFAVTSTQLIAPTSIELGHATDTTLTRSGAGDVAVEGNTLYRAGGTDVAIADGGSGASTVSGARTAFQVGDTAVPFHTRSDASLAWTQPAADTFLLGSTRHIVKVDLTNNSQCRLFVNKTSVAANTGAKLHLRYYTVASTSVGDYLQIGTSQVSLAIDVASGLLDTGWINLASGAKGFVWVAVVGSGGDGVISPQFGNILAYFR